MLKALPAALVVATLSWPALAQQPATEGARPDRGTVERGARWTDEDRAAMLDARMAAMRTGLKLTPEQEKNWPAVETALRDLSKQRAQFAEERREAREKNDPIDRLRTAADIMGQRAAGLKRLADASEPLYKSLDEGQKRRLQALTRQAAQGEFRRHRGWR